MHARYCRVKEIQDSFIKYQKKKKNCIKFKNTDFFLLLLKKKTEKLYKNFNYKSKGLKYYKWYFYTTVFFFLWMGTSFNYINNLFFHFIFEFVCIIFNFLTTKLLYIWIKIYEVILNFRAMPGNVSVIFYCWYCLM